MRRGGLYHHATRRDMMRSSAGPMGARPLLRVAWLPLGPWHRFARAVFTPPFFPPGQPLDVHARAHAPVGPIRKQRRRSPERVPPEGARTWRTSRPRARTRPSCSSWTSSSTPARRLRRTPPGDGGRLVPTRGTADGRRRLSMWRIRRRLRAPCEVVLCPDLDTRRKGSQSIEAPVVRQPLPSSPPAGAERPQRRHLHGSPGARPPDPVRPPCLLGRKASREQGVGRRSRYASAA